jgi:hypothetical protein
MPREGIHDPHVGALDEIGAIEIERLISLIESADKSGRAWSDAPGRGKKAPPGAVAGFRCLEGWRSSYGLTHAAEPHRLARQLAEGGLAAEIARRRSE